MLSTSTSYTFVHLAAQCKTAFFRPRLNRLARPFHSPAPLLRQPARRRTSRKPRVRTWTSEADGPNTHISPESLRHSTPFLQNVWKAAIQESGARIAIDATAGRGSDALILCKFLGASGTVHAFDIQQAALCETQARYDAQHKISPDLAGLTLHLRCHSALRACVDSDAADVACVAYNLGWYPGRDADRAVITQAESTVASLGAAAELLAPGGIISVMGYIGHAGGAHEEEAVHQWSSTLDSRLWTVVRMTYPNRKQAPTILLCQRCIPHRA